MRTFRMSGAGRLLLTGIGMMESGRSDRHMSGKRNIQRQKHARGGEYQEGEKNVFLRRKREPRKVFCALFFQGG